MKNHGTKLFVSALTPVLTLAIGFSHAAAQAPPPPEHRQWEVTGFGGGSFIGGFQFPTAIIGSPAEASRTVGMHYASGYQAGIRVSQNFHDFWAAALEYSFANQPLRLTNLSPEVQSLSLSDFIHRLSYNVLYLPAAPERRFRPYGSIGAGAALFFIAGDSKEDAAAVGVPLRDDWKFTFNWGGGFKYLVHDQVAIGFDVKDQISGVPSYGLPHSATLKEGRYIPGISRNGLMQNWQFNLGIAFQWDE
jgi:opacity protein-like surface antigen